jgi:hypothetical protein
VRRLVNMTALTAVDASTQHAARLAQLAARPPWQR